jgi:hypothetical protein
VGEWRVTTKRVLPYENNAHSYRLTVAKLAQSKINIANFVALLVNRIYTRRSVAPFGRINA